MPDPKQCQGEITTTGGSFMTLGPRPRQTERCPKKPVVIAYENQAGPDGQKGSMSLCAECADAMLKQLTAEYATLVSIWTENKDGVREK